MGEGDTTMRAGIGALARRHLAAGATASGGVVFDLRSSPALVAAARGRRSVPPTSCSPASTSLPLTAFPRHFRAKNNNEDGRRRTLHTTAAAAANPAGPAEGSGDVLTDPKRFCVVGSGPAGMYATDRLLAHYGRDARVDIVERLPTPFGLVRSGVAPDHAGTKAVTNRFGGILADPRVTFLGNVALGRDVHVADLAPRYLATVLAYGAEGDRRLDVPGEDLSGVYSAREFVGWYNGDPTCVRALDGAMTESLARSDGDTAVIFGLGNVAVDCARVLLKRPEHLADTDICQHALRTLQTSTVRRVVMVGRRGVAQGAFSPKELRELLSLPGVKVTVDLAELELAPEDEADLAAQRPRRRAFEAISKAVTAPPATGVGDGRSDDRELVLKFLRSPLEFLPSGGEGDGGDGSGSEGKGGKGGRGGDPGEGWGKGEDMDGGGRGGVSGGGGGDGSGGSSRTDRVRSVLLGVNILEGQTLNPKP